MKLLQNILMTLIMFLWFGMWFVVYLIVIPLEAQAKDFGIEGHTYQIIEEDFLEVIAGKIKKTNWDEVNKKIQTKTKEYVERPTAVLGITRAKESKEFFYDPSYVLTQDIRDQNNQIIHKAGIEVNLLEFNLLREALLFIDGDDDKQIKLALSLYKEQEEKLKIILVKGEPLKLQREQREQKIWIYFDQAGFLTQKLGINEVPALVTQDGLRLKISVIGETQ